MAQSTSGTLLQGLFWVLLSAACSSCALSDPSCRQARAEHQRQLELEANASPGGVDPEAVQRSETRQRQACGFTW